MKIHIVQPVIPHYRVSFFNELYKYNEGLEFYASVQDDIGVKGVSQNNFFYKKLGCIRSFAGVVWQSNILSVVSNFKKNDKLVINGNPRYISNFFLVLLAKIIGVKVIWWGQGWSSNTNAITFKVRALLMQMCDAVMLYTDIEKELFTSARFKEKIYALNNGLDNREIIKYSAEYDPEKRSNEILFIGRLTDKSHLETLLYALENLDKDIVLNVIGDGPNAKKYKELSKLLGLANRVRFLGSVISEKKIASIANSSKIFVYPGNVGLSLIHAFNYGLPAIVHSATKKHMPEISCFDSNITGETFESANIEDMKLVIEDLINDNDKLKKYSLECKRRVLLSYNVESMALRFHEALCSIK